MLAHIYAGPTEIKNINDIYDVKIVKSDDMASANSYWEIRNKNDHTIAYSEKMLLGYQMSSLTSII